jgi:hypothetical protein
MRSRFLRAIGLLSIALAPVWAASMLRPATLVIDGSIRFTLGSGGAGFTRSRRSQAGIILFDLQTPRPFANAGFISYNGYRGGGNMVPELSGTAHIRLNSRAWYPWTAAGSDIRVVFIPLWPAAVVAVFTAASWWRAWRKVPDGHCRKCRYDLRTLPPGSPCPECGAPAQFGL